MKIPKFLQSIAAAAIALLSGCVSTPAQSLVLQVAIQQGTSRFIENSGDRATRAMRVLSVVASLKAIAQSDKTTVADLQAEALDRVALAKLEPSDAALANALIGAVGEALRARVSDGVLKPDDALRVSAALDSIAATAKLYVPVTS